MGTYLSTPVTDKQTEDGLDLQCTKSPLAWGVVEMQGWRKSMEDAHLAESNLELPQAPEKAKVFGVFDGHGGPEVARFCQLYFTTVLQQQLMAAPATPPKADATGNINPKDSPIGVALQATFHALDRMIDDPTRRTEMNRLRAIPPRHNFTLVDPHNIPPPQPNWTAQQLLEQKQAQHIALENYQESPTLAPRAAANAVPTMELETDNDEVPFDERADAEQTKNDETKAEGETAVVNNDEEEGDNHNPNSSSPVKDKEEDNESGVKDKDDDSPNDDNTNTPEFVAEKKDDDSDAVVGREEASQLDQDWMGDEDDEESSSEDGTRSDGSRTTPNKVDTADDDDKEDDRGSFVLDASSATAEDDETDGDADTEDEATSGGGSGTAGKVSVMFQRLLKLSSNDTKKQSSSPNNAKHNDATEPTIPPAAWDADPSLPGPPTRVVTTEPASILQGGRRVCQLPDHTVPAGATAVVAVLMGQELTVANAGDSRAVLSRNGVAFPLSFDHKPTSDVESRRIQRAGGFVNHFGRVNGNLNLSRSIGDLKYKQVAGVPASEQMITAQPDLVQVTLQGVGLEADTNDADNDGSTSRDEFIILGCDGIWDCLTNQQAVDYVAQRLPTQRPTEIGAEMLDEILSVDPRTTQGVGGDNMTLLIVDLQPHTRAYYNVAATTRQNAPQPQPVDPIATETTTMPSAAESSPLSLPVSQPTPMDAVMPVVVEPAPAAIAVVAQDAAEGRSLAL